MQPPEPAYSPYQPVQAFVGGDWRPGRVLARRYHKRLWIYTIEVEWGYPSHNPPQLVWNYPYNLHDGRIRHLEAA